MEYSAPILLALAALATCGTFAAPSPYLPHGRARAVEVPEGFWYESLPATAQLADTDDDPNVRVPEVFHNGAWTPDISTSLNAYVAALLSKDVYFKHVIDPRGNPASRRNFTLFTRLFCLSMTRLGADDCEVVAGPYSLVWAVVRAGASVLLVVRGSNSPQNWITDVTSLRTTNVADFGGGSRGTNVALGFYQVFAANRKVMVERVEGAMARAAATAAAAAAGAASGLTGAARDPRLWVFGHSLGGAVALMAASYLDVREGFTATGVYTYGCPRVGDESWAQSYQLHDVTSRLENAGDIIPTLPFGISWRHVGTAAVIQACKSLSQSVSERAAAEATVAAAAVDAEGGRDDGRRQQGRRLLRGGGAAADASAGASADATAAAALYGTGTEPGPETTALGNAATAAEAAEEVEWPFPVSFRDHWVQTYVQVLWSCLPDKDQDLVPGPEDVYDKLDAAAVGEAAAAGASGVTRVAMVYH